MDLEAEIDRLYGLPLDEFVAQRAELAKRLRADGEREAAEQVKGLRKPTLGAWAINQATRHRESERDELLAAGERLRTAHEGLLSGGDAAPLRDATRDERALVAKLADTAAAIATEGGKGGPALLERLRNTLHAAALDDEVREELAGGRVLREREASGLGMLGEAALPTRGSQRRGSPSKRSGGATVEERRHAEAVATAQAALDEARAELAEAESARDEAAARLEAARETLEQARADQTTTRRTARERARELARLERALERLRSQAPDVRSKPG